MLEKKVFVLKVAALSTVQTGRFPRLTGRRFYDCVPSTREHGGSRTSCDSTNKESYPSQPFTKCYAKRL
jgi:hypothetical protein